MNPPERWLIDRAAREPARTAIIDSTGRYTYADLSKASFGIAGRLLDGRTDLAEARVAFLEPPGFRHIATQWGIWRAGGVAVPLAMNHPVAELAYALDDSEAAIAIAHPAHQSRLEPVARERNIRFATALPSAGAPLPEVDPSRRAMMIYTSGTTGRPKGVVTTHANIRAQITPLVDTWGCRADDRLLHTLPLHHVHGIIIALSSALWAGASTEFAEFEPVAIWERLASGEITLFMGVPTMYSRLIAAWDAGDAGNRRRWSFGARSLRLMVSGSAALPVSTLARWRSITGHTLLERYGMTEIGVGLSNPLEGERRAGTVGRPLPGVDVQLTDERGTPVDAGTSGQIEIRGSQVFREYWRRPDESARAFRDGWFMTGDVAIVEDGYYRILGRESVDIIKSAGYKISALEVEEALREHPGVRDCAVVGIADDDLGERVAAAVVSDEGNGDSAERLREWAKGRLAPYKVPRTIVFVDDLPRNAMGKVIKPDVRALIAARA